MTELWPKSHLVTRIVLSRCKGIPDVFGNNYAYIAHLAATVPGDYIELGTRFGYSACVAALAKKMAGTPGKVWAVDPLIEGGRPDGQPRVRALACPGPDILANNASACGVEVALIRDVSYPWPGALEDAKFSVAYIDGDHWGAGPINDWDSLRVRTTGYVAFDNYEDSFPAIKIAVHAAMVASGWRLWLKDGPLAIVTAEPDTRMVW